MRLLTTGISRVPGKYYFWPPHRIFEWPHNVVRRGQGFHEAFHGGIRLEDRTTT